MNYIQNIVSVVAVGFIVVGEIAIALVTMQ